VERGSIAIKDNGLGIPATTIESVLDYSIRVSRGKPTLHRRVVRRATRSRPSCRWPMCSTSATVRRLPATP
jgi:hypothetical protein